MKKILIGTLLILSILFAFNSFTILPVFSAENESKVFFIPNIGIPGTKFQKGAKIEITSLTIPEFVLGLYNFTIRAVGIFAFVMLLFAGWRWLTASGNPNLITQAKDTAYSAIFGLVLALLSYVLLNTINPRLTDLPAIALQYIRPFEMVAKEEVKPVPEEEQIEYPSLDLVKVDHKNIRNVQAEYNDKVGGPAVSRSTWQALKKAADMLDEKDENGDYKYQYKGQKVLIGLQGAWRSYNYQKKLWEDICKGKPCSFACRPDPDRANCPHTTGKAVDITCWNYHSTDSCQKEVIFPIMKKAGFCKHAQEDWHFEYPKVSPLCTFNY